MGKPGLSLIAYRLIAEIDFHRLDESSEGQGETTGRRHYLPTWGQRMDYRQLAALLPRRSASPLLRGIPRYL